MNHQTHAKCTGPSCENATSHWTGKCQTCRKAVTFERNHVVGKTSNRRGRKKNAG